MKTLARHAAASLLETLNFTGLSGEQAILATIVSENPSSNPRVRRRAKSLLLLDGGSTATEVSRSMAISRRSLLELIERFRTGGLCAALLGLHASAARRAWLTLSPSSAPRVQLQPASCATHCVVEREDAVPARGRGQAAFHAHQRSIHGASCRCSSTPT